MGIQINGQTDIVTSTTAGGKVTIPAATFPSVTDLNATGIVTASSFVPTGSSVPANGMYLPTTNILAFASGSSERVRIDSSGNLGIGTNIITSGYRVEVQDITNNYAIRVRNPANTQSIRIGSSDPEISSTGKDFQIRTTDAYSLQLWTNNTERARIDSSGNFGLGTGSPTTRLDIRSTSTVSDSTRYNLLLMDISSYASGVGGGINLGYIYNSSGNYIQRAASIGVRKENATDGDYASALTFHTTANSASTVERMRIDSSGRITTPYQPYAIVSFQSGDVGASNNKVTSSTGALVVPTYIVSNSFSLYNSSNGRFTAPVSGLYEFGFSADMAINGVTGAWISALTFKNGTLSLWHYDNLGTGSWQYLTFSDRVSLSANDYLELRFATASGSIGSDVGSNWNQVYFKLIG